MAIHCHNTGALPVASLHAHLAEAHAAAVRIQPLLDAIEGTIGDRDLDNLTLEILNGIGALAEKIAFRLDTVNLPKLAPAETPVSQLFSEWQPADAAFANADEADEARLYDVRWAALERLMNAPSQNATDVLIKMNAWTAFGANDIEGKYNNYLEVFWAEARAQIGGEA